MVPTECQHKTTFKSCFVKVTNNIINKLCFSALEYSCWLLKRQSPQHIFSWQGPMWLVVDRAGQCRNNPWPAVPDWTLRPEYRCRTEAADYRKKCRCRTNLSPVYQFRHLHDFSMAYSKNNTISHVQGKALWTFTTCTLQYPFHHHQH